MKKLVSLVLIIVMVFSIAGCGCSHTWSEADCTNAAVCTKCGESGSQALGHDWPEAGCESAASCRRCGEIKEALPHNWLSEDCESPLVCTLCGETRGEAPGHEYSFSGTDGGMYKVECSVCGESKTMDRDEYISFCVSGCWTAIYGEELITLDISEDGSFTADFGKGYWGFGRIEDTGRVRLEFVCVPEEKEKSSYKLQAELVSVDEISLTTVYNPEIFPLEVQSLMFKKLSEAMRALVEEYAAKGVYREIIGELNSVSCRVINWESDEENTIADTSVSLVLNEDGSFSGNIMGPVSGTWRPEVQRIFQDSLYFRCYLICDGAEGPYPELDYHIYLTGASSVLRSLSIDEGGISYIYDIQKLSAEEAAAVNETINDSDELILGEWQSSGYHFSDPNAGEYSSGIDSTVNIKLNEDGSFTGQLDGAAFSGSWENSYTGVHDEVYRHYDLSFDPSGPEELLSARCTVIFSSDPDTGNYNVSFSCHVDDEEKSTVYSLRKADGDAAVPGEPEQAAAAASLSDEYIIGSWNSVSCQRNNFASGEIKMQADTSVKLVLEADGSFSGELNGPVSGIWQKGQTLQHGDSTEQMYMLQFSGSSQTDTISVISSGTSPEQIYVNFYHNDGNESFNYTMQQLSQQELEQLISACEAAAGKISGKWKAVEYSCVDNSTLQTTNLDQPNYSIEFKPDGSFVRSFESVENGEWSFYSFMNNWYNYSLTIPGNQMPLNALLVSDSRLNISWPSEDYTLNYNCFFEKVK